MTGTVIFQIRLGKIWETVERIMTESDDKKLFTDSAFYLLAHHRRILSDSTLYLCRVPVRQKFMGSVIGLTLGCCIEWWKDYSFTRFYSGEKKEFIG